MAPHGELVTVDAPLHPEAGGLFGDEPLAAMESGSYLVNAARAKIVDPGCGGPGPAERAVGGLRG
ncbi:NAD(P)-dependent oxidoreductase [Streptomyces sp. NPDC056352]|uniref:NAD(P)-dependent oxidoreductase n=1 Tax=Streptomyces sp. NPDC056352 TaxID=3345791 RepID=UPI0035DE1EF7